MPASLRFVLLAALLLLGSGGWGSATASVLRRLGWDDVTDEVGPSLQLLLGVGEFLAVSGLLVALNAAYFVALLVWHVIGVALLVQRRKAIAQVLGDSWRIVVGVVASGAALTLLAVGTAMSGSVNIFDDTPAYIYFAKRLLATGGLIDPFNFRRITGYGASSVYQSMFYQVSGSASLRGFEFLFSSLVLVIVTVETIRRRWLVAGLIVIGIAIVLGFGLGPVSNLSPECSVAALSLGIFKLLGALRRDSHPLVFVVIGVLMAAVASLRFTYLLAVVVAMFLVVVIVYGRHAIRALALVGGATVVCCLGWAIALDSSSRTPLYPLLAGNANTTWPSGGDPSISSLGGHLRLLGDVFTGHLIGLAAVISIAVAVAYLATDHATGKALALLAAGFGSLVQMVVFAYAFSGLTLDGLVRYEAPSTLACALLTIDLVWPHRATRQEPLKPASERTWKALRVPVATVAVLLAVVLAVADESPVSYVHSAFHGARIGAQALLSETDFVDPYTSDEPSYREINTLIPRGADVLAAVDEPALLDASKYRFATLDIAGAVSPPPHMPFFRGAAATVRYLRSIGVEYVVASAPAVRGLYWLTFYTHLAPYLSDYHDRAWAPYMIDWEGTVTALEDRGGHRVWHAGSLTLIRI